MKTIIVIGASGQVGTELCLILQGFLDVRVIAICRSGLAGALLKRGGVTCRVGSMLLAEDARRLLEGGDVIFDLSLPAGPEPEARRINRQLIALAVAESPRDARYVFASTYMALGMNGPGETFRHRFISKTAYGAKKRVMERAAFDAGRVHGREVFVLRLGQVHGELQSVSRHVLSGMSSDLTEVPRGPSNTVFVSTIAEGLVGIAEGREVPGLYMMVSNPQWSWRELHQYFADKAGVHPPVVETAPTNAARLSTLRSWAVAVVAGRREFITGYLLPGLPDAESKARAWHHVRNARSQLAQAPARRPYSYAYAGNAPGARLKSPTDSRGSVHKYATLVQATLGALVR